MATCMDCLEYSNGYCYYYKLYLSQLDYPYENGGASNCPGFNGKSSSGCFLTSALVHYLGKKDDCEELTLLRAFRDNYMKSFDEGRKLVEEYYEVAPKIVSAIETSDKRKEYYSDINDTVSACIKLIKQGKNQETMGLYCSMVNKYKALAY
ncbi:MAG: hypothetical protein IJQ23_06530 [Clostridia bacterium]|nr:hypothetical protein [Clostridia bacterium]